MVLENRVGSSSPGTQSQLWSANQSTAGTSPACTLLVWLVAAEGAELAGECITLSRLCAQAPRTNLTDPAWRIDLLSPQSTHGTEAEVLLSVVTPARAWHSSMIYTGGLVSSSATNLWVETHWTLVRFHWCQVSYHTRTSPGV